MDDMVNNKIISQCEKKTFWDSNRHVLAGLNAFQSIDKNYVKKNLGTFNVFSWIEYLLDIAQSEMVPHALRAIKNILQIVPKDVLLQSKHACKMRL